MTGAVPDNIDAQIARVVARAKILPTSLLQIAFPTPVFR
jgi:hypothetical protein